MLVILLASQSILLAKKWMLNDGMMKPEGNEINKAWIDHNMIQLVQSI